MGGAYYQISVLLIAKWKVLVLHQPQRNCPVTLAGGRKTVCRNKSKKYPTDLIKSVILPRVIYNNYSCPSLEKSLWAQFRKRKKKSLCSILNWYVNRPTFVKLQSHLFILSWWNNVSCTRYVDVIYNQCLTFSCYKRAKKKVELCAEI